MKTNAAGLAEFKIKPKADQLRVGNWGQRDIELLGGKQQIWGPQIVLDLLATAKDPKGNTASARVALNSHPMGENVLLRLDKAIYQPGDRMAIDIRTSAGMPTVFVDIVRGGQIMLSKWLEVKDGKALQTLDLPQTVFGTLEIHAYQMLPGRDHSRQPGRLRAAAQRPQGDRAAGQDGVRPRRRRHHSLPGDRRQGQADGRGDRRHRRRRGGLRLARFAARPGKGLLHAARRAAQAAGADQAQPRRHDRQPRAAAGPARPAPAGCRGAVDGGEAARAEAGCERGPGPGAASSASTGQVAANRRTMFNYVWNQKKDVIAFDKATGRWAFRADMLSELVKANQLAAAMLSKAASASN